MNPDLQDILDDLHVAEHELLKYEKNTACVRTFSTIAFQPD